MTNAFGRVLGTAALLLAAACAGGGDDRGGAGTSTASTTGGASGPSASGSTSASSRSSAAGSGTSSGVDAGSGEAGSPSDGGAVWSPSATAPIHFHWMIGGFTTADILPGQAGTVVYDIDGENATTGDVAAIHAAGAIAVCYVDVGTLEKGRSDYGQFPASAIGPVVSGWPDENWLLVSPANQSSILPLMKARFDDWCKAKGFDAIEPDNLDGWTNTTEISQTDNLTYDRAIAQLAHAIPLSIGLKNLATDLTAGQLPDFVSAFDWALQEQCYEYSDCAVYSQTGSFIPSGRAVFDVEYNVAPDCTDANQARMNAQRSDLDLVGATTTGYVYQPCIPDSQTTW